MNVLLWLVLALFAIYYTYAGFVYNKESKAYSHRKNKEAN